MLWWICISLPSNSHKKQAEDYDPATHPFIAIEQQAGYTQLYHA